MLIGEVSRRTGISARMLRHYDTLGIVSPTGRTVGGYREYSEVDLRRLFHVESLRSLGMSLRELHRALDDPDFTPSTLVQELIASTEARIDREQDLLRRLRHVQASDADEWTDVLRLIALLRGLESDDPRARQRSALATAGEAAPSARLLAEKVLDEAEVNVAGALRWALRRSGSDPGADGTLDVLVPALDSPDADRRMRAMMALAELEPSSADATAALVGALGNADPAVRGHAALALGSRGDSLAIPELLAMIVAGVRDVDAADALVRVADAHDLHEQVVASLTEELARPGVAVEVRLRLVQALAEIRGPAADAALGGLSADGERAVALTARAILGARR